VPTDETIEILLDLAFRDGVNTYKDLERHELRDLLEICTKKAHFQFNGKFYDQIDGVAMGSPLGPLFANAYMSHFENMYMNELRALGVTKWYRYVDDIFAVVKSKEQAEQVLEFLNTRASIRFTIEHESNNKLPFLDTCVVRQRTKYITTVFRKKTFTGVYLNWTSLTSRSYKIGLIKCLAERTWRICSEKNDRIKELDKLKAILLTNDYPSHIVEKVIEKFLKKKENPNVNVYETAAKEDKVKKFITLPYGGSKCDDFARKLKTLTSNTLPKVELNVAFQAPFTIGKLFPFKDNIKKAMDRSSVVYWIRCKSCSCSYIGYTDRTLSQRVHEHETRPSSACYQHQVTHPGHKMDFANTRIIDTGDSELKLRIKELLHITKKKPRLNKQLGTQSQFDIKTIIVAKHQQFQTKA
jgi:hypothetical protein